MRHWTLAGLALLLGGCGAVERLVDPKPEPPRLGVAAVPAQQLAPGAQVTVPLSITRPEGVTEVRVGVQSPDPDLLAVSTDGAGSVTIRAAAGALPQGLVPVTVTVEGGGQTVTTRVGVEIGHRIAAEFARFNAIRAQAGLRAVTFDESASMNCWLHGRYSVVNDAGGHNQDPARPFASPEGLACASTSNLAWSSLPAAELPSRTVAADLLYSVPFHAVGMLHPGQARVGIGSYARRSPQQASWAQTGSGITSVVPQGAAGGGVRFPGDGQTTDLFRYPGGEWPDPLTVCAGHDSRSTGLPLVMTITPFTETTATAARLTDGAGAALEVCAYGSSQYVNTTDTPGNYVGGPISAQDIGRSIMRGYGAVCVIPKTPLRAAQTYRVNVTVNGTPHTWTFKTASVLRGQALGPGPEDVRAW